MHHVAYIFLMNTPYRAFICAILRIQTCRIHAGVCMGWLRSVGSFKVYFKGPLYRCPNESRLTISRLLYKEVSLQNIGLFYGALFAKETYNLETYILYRDLFTDLFTEVQMSHVLRLVGSFKAPL